MKKITFVTTNKGKISTAKQYLNDVNIELEPYNYELIEPRTDDIQEIAKQKVLQAYPDCFYFSFPHFHLQ